MHRLVLTLLTLSLLFAQESQRGVARAPEPALAAAAGSYYALIIGIDEYKSMPHLKTAVFDARSLEAELRDGYHFKTSLLVNDQASRAAILKELYQYRTALHDSDNLLIYFAGHGIKDEAADRAYWLPADSDASGVNGISADDISAVMRALAAKHVLVVSDSCYSGTMADSRAPSPPPATFTNAAEHQTYLQKKLALTSRTFLSSGGDEPVADGGADGHSVFAGAVLHALKEMEGTAFTAENLYQWRVQERVGGASAQTPKFDWIRNSGHKEGDFVFIGGTPAEAAKTDRQAPDSQRATLDPAEESWNQIRQSQQAEDFDEFITQFPDSRLAASARLAATRLRRASASPTAEAPPVKPPPANPSPTLRPGQVSVNPEDGLRYVWIPPGSFQMGCSPGDKECGADESPAHQVTLTKGFSMGQTPVTVGAWKRYLAAGGPALPSKSGDIKINEAAGNDALPAVAMTWDEARGYCEWAGKRLPTEAQWEYAARAGSNTARYGPLDSIAWYIENRFIAHPVGLKEADDSILLDFLAAHPVGQKQANAWGLFDTLGNVYHWTADWYDEKYYQDGASQDPTGPPSGTFRALRGGSGLPQDVRVSNRNRVVPDSRNYHIGVRCVGGSALIVR